MLLENPWPSVSSVVPPAVANFTLYVRFSSDVDGISPENREALDDIQLMVDCMKLLQ